VERKREEVEKQAQRDHALKQAEALEDQKRTSIQRKLKTTEKKLQQKFSQKELERALEKEQKFLKQVEKEEQVIRMQRIDDYHREQLD
jgi:hypothetical protein